MSAQVMLLPIRLIMQLQLPVQQRIGVAATFAVGILCVVASQNFPDPPSNLELIYLSNVAVRQC